jgi:hypothetical protein
VFHKERVVGSEKDHGPDRGRSNRRSRWGRRGVIALLLIGMGTLAVKSVSWLTFSLAGGGEYQVITEWQSATGGKGLMIAISPHSTFEELRAVGRRLRDKFHSVDNAAVMVFDDAGAAREVRRGSRVVGETDFQAALVRQRAMYLKSTPRGEDSFTIYRAYPAVAEIIRFEEDDLRTTTR